MLTLLFSEKDLCYSKYCQRDIYSYISRSNDIMDQYFEYTILLQKQTRMRAARKSFLKDVIFEASGGSFIMTYNENVHCNDRVFFTRKMLEQKVFNAWETLKKYNEKTCIIDLSDVEIHLRVSLRNEKHRVPVVDECLDPETRTFFRLDTGNSSDEEEEIKENDDDNDNSDDNGDDTLNKNAIRFDDDSDSDDDHYDCSDGTYTDYGSDLEEGERHSSSIFLSQVYDCDCLLLSKCTEISESMITAMNFFVNRMVLGATALSFRKDLDIVGYHNGRLFASQHAQRKSEVVADVMKIPEISKDMLVFNSGEFTKLDYTSTQHDIVTLGDWERIIKFENRNKELHR